MPMRITAQLTGPLVISEIASDQGTSARRGVTAPDPVLPPEFQSDKVSVEKVYVIALQPAAAAQRGGELPMLSINAETADDEAALVVVRHASGAIGRASCRERV